MDDSKAPFLKHFAELRKVVLHSVLVVIALFFPCYLFRIRLLELIVRPVTSALPEGGSLIFTKPSEGFVALIQASVFAAFVLASPFILYRIWRFIAPGLRSKEKKGAVSFVLFGTVQFFTGVWFCHAVAAPRAFAFLLAEPSAHFLSAMPSVGQSLSFLMSMCLGFGVVFEFPLIALLLSRWGVVTAAQLGAARKYAYVAGTAIIAVITPTTDFASMMFLLVPLAVFYEAGIVAARVFGAKGLET